jgi:hypothetical protein
MRREFNDVAGVDLQSANAGDKTKYVELISGAVYPLIAGTVSIVGTVSIAVPGQTDPRKVTASSVVEIVDAALMGVNLASGEMPPTNTVSVDKTIRFTATAAYGGGLTQAVTSPVVWVSADPNVAMVSNAAGTFGGSAGHRRIAGAPWTSSLLSRQARRHR